MALFTAADFKEHEGISGTAHDALIANLALRATAAINRYCRRTFEGATYTEELDGTGLDIILVKEPPVRTVTTLKVSTDRDFSNITAVDASTYVFDDSGTITLLPTASLGIFATTTPVFWKGVRNIQVVYEGGFATVPVDVEQAAILLASAWFNRRRMGGIQSSTTGAVTLSFQASTWPSEVRALLAGYRLHTMPVGWSN